MPKEFFRLFFYFVVIVNNFEISLSENTNEDTEGKIDIFNKCYEDIGCIETDSRWYDSNIRPVNLKPLDRHIIKTDFLLIKANITTNNSNHVDLVYDSLLPKSDALTKSNFSKNLDVLFLIHDFTSNGYTGWIKHISCEIFKNSRLKFNIISVDWQRGAEPPFDQAIANARLVGLEVVAFIKHLKERFQVDPEQIQIVGHGVGAHIAGYVGQTYSNLKKITALDPTGPRFAGMTDIVKLSKSNAKYVEVLHTDANINDRSQGTKESMGHVDFFINDGAEQPGCLVNTSYPKLVKVERNSLDEGEILPACSHKRAFKYFIETLYNHHCSFMGIKCKDLEEFRSGKCINCGGAGAPKCQTFGLTYNLMNSSQGNGLYFLNTAQDAPFCLFQYSISIEMLSAEPHYGYFNFIFIDESRDISNLSLSDPKSNYRTFNKTSDNNYVYYGTPPKLSKIIEAKVRWNEEKKIYCFIYCKQTIHIGRITVENIAPDKVYKTQLCPKFESKESAELENGVYSTFVPCTGAETNKNNNEEVSTYSAESSTSINEFTKNRKDKIG